jgi:hypothetical protein
MTTEEQKFRPFPKITRFLEQDVVITEKIDGTNGVIKIYNETDMLIGSRNRWITPEDDNHGFARWCQTNKEDLLKLGEGTHYGEWWGQGIQRGYNMRQKVFSLFNATRWKNKEDRPECCDVVPILYEGIITPNIIADFGTKNPLLLSQVALHYGVKYNKPEGYMLWMSKGQNYYKIPLNK